MFKDEQVKKIQSLILEGKRLVDWHPSQKIIYDDNTRYKIVCSGRYFGKSILIISECFRAALKANNQTVNILSPTNELSKINIWYPLLQLIDIIPGLKEQIKKISDREMQVLFNNGSRIKLRSAEKTIRLRGARIDYVGVDEYSYILTHQGKDVWLALEPSINASGGAILVSTPDGMNRFYELYKMGQENNGVYKSWLFKTTDNVTEPELIRKVADARLALTAAEFKQEYEGDFTTSEGKICKDFNDNNVVEFKIKIFDGLKIQIGADFNVNPMCWVAFQILNPLTIKQYYPDFDISNLQDEIIYFFKEWKEKNTCTEHQCLKVMDYLQDINYNDYLTWFGDASGRNRDSSQTIDLHSGQSSTNWNQIKSYMPNSYFKYDNKNPGQGNRLVSTRAKIKNSDGKIGLLIHKSCENLINDFQSVRYKDDGGINKKLEKQGIGHLFDAATYPIHRLWNLRGNNQIQFGFVNNPFAIAMQ